MASGWYTNGLLNLLNSGKAITDANMRALLVSSAYTYNPDHDVVSDVAGSEITTVTNYARKTVALTIAANDSSNRLEVTVPDISWTSLGGSVNATVAAVILYYQLNTGSAVNASDILVGYLDLADFTTNGSDFTADMAASGGNLRINI
jgi:hypothetical protein